MLSITASTNLDKQSVELLASFSRLVMGTKKLFDADNAKFPNDTVPAERQQATYADIPCQLPEAEYRHPCDEQGQERGQAPLPYAVAEQQHIHAPHFPTQSELSSRSLAMYPSGAAVTGAKEESVRAKITAGSYSVRWVQALSRNAQNETTKTRLDKALARIEFLKVENSRADGQIAHLKKEREHNEEERERLEAGFRKLQQHVFRRFESPSWKPDTNGAIQRKLSQLDYSAKNWSKDSCLSELHSLEPNNSPSVHKNLRKDIRDFINVDNEPGYAYLPQGKEWVIIHAYIMHHLYFDIFDHPFFGVHSQPGEDVDTQTDKVSSQIMSTKHHDETTDFSESLRLLYSKFRACR
jgi:hypothetical protein